MIFREWIAALPKVELHLHLEGAIPYDALWRLVEKYGGDEELPSVEALRGRLEYRDFPHFIETWIWKNQFIREYDDFEMIAEAVAADLAQQNVCYAEAFYSPRDFAKTGLTLSEITRAMRRGLDKVAEIEVALVADLIRDFGPDSAAQALDELREVRDQGVIGIGIGGSEQDFPPEPFAAVYDRARCFGFRTNAHAGEAAGPASVWGAIRTLQVDRIGHGTRAVEDAELLDYLSETGTPIELCPISNVCTGVIQSIGEHPIGEYLRRGLTVCINTDDPKMFHNTLVDEFDQLRTHHDVTTEQTKALLESAIESSWMAADAKIARLSQLRTHEMWNVEPT
ncbi:MAG: adenosine deaminase [Pirellulaceae bacterium]|jgi:adenosine deaminase|nr:adenosine deaminase [Pirellulaceae bacterium]MDP7019317.1 adenosine deaminase [Pirellulaceae bacterium]